MTTKRDSIDNFLRTGDVVRLYVDPRGDAVVPPQFKADEWLVIDVGLNLPRPIPDLALSSDAVYGTLSFGGRPYYCELPYAAIHAIKHVASGVVVQWSACGTAHARHEAAVAARKASPVVDLMSRRTQADAAAVRRRLSL